MREDRSGYAVLISLATREEAEVAAAALRADGVDAFLGNSNHSGIQWFYIFALGGLPIMVPRQKLVEAKAALRERIRENAALPPEDHVERRDRWKLWVVAALFSPLLLFFLIAALLVGWSTSGSRRVAS